MNPRTRHVGTALAVLVTSLVIGTVAASCEIVAGLDGNFRAAPDAGAAGDAGAPDTGPTGCQSATYPDPPGGVDDGTDVGGIVVAIHTVDLGDGATTPGYDLDHVCTCTDDAGPSCVGRSTQTGAYCDAPGGIDNGFAKIVQLLEIPLGPSTFSSAAFSSKANLGLWTLLIEIHGYNGAKNDPAVQVSLYPCPGLGATPKWDGTDSWAVLDTDVTGTGAPVFQSNGAYVAGSTLVASVPSVPITLAGAKETITLTLSGAVITGQLVQSNGEWRLIQGVLAARLGVTDFFTSLSAFRDNQGLPLCTDAGFIYSTAKASVCNGADILLDGTQPSSAPCDAILVRDGLHRRPGAARPSGAAADAHSRLPACDGPCHRLLRAVAPGSAASRSQKKRRHSPHASRRSRKDARHRALAALQGAHSTALARPGP